MKNQKKQISNFIDEKIIIGRPFPLVENQEQEQSPEVQDVEKLEQSPEVQEIQTMYDVTSLIERINELEKKVKPFENFEQAESYFLQRAENVKVIKRLEQILGQIKEGLEFVKNSDYIGKPRDIEFRFTTGKEYAYINDPYLLAELYTYLIGRINIKISELQKQIFE